MRGSGDVTALFMTGRHAALRSWQVVDLPCQQTKHSWRVGPVQGRRLSDPWGRWGHTATRCVKLLLPLFATRFLGWDIQCPAVRGTRSRLQCCVAKDGVNRSVDSRLRSVPWLRGLVTVLPARAEDQVQCQGSPCEICGEVSLGQVFFSSENFGFHLLGSFHHF